MATSRRATSAWRKTLGFAAIAAAAFLVGLAAAAPQPQYTPTPAAAGAAAAGAATPAASQQNQCAQVRTRRSLQSLTPADRNAFVQGVLKLKQTGVIDGLARRHRAGMQWHGTPLFMPMHRALMKEFEEALLKVAPTLSGVPYWDELQDTRGIQTSAIFGNALMGPLAKGPLQGPFKGFTDDRGAPVTRDPLQASAGFSWLPSSQVMATVMQRMVTFGNLSSIVEVSPHNQFHALVGGTMGDVTVSPADPLFWTHHAYIDLLWALWQSLSPGNVDRLDAPFQGKSSVPLDAPVVLYEKMYTNRDMTRYRTRLCYQYIVPTTTAPKSKRSPNPEPKPAPAPAPQPNGGHHYGNHGKCARPKPQPHFTSVQELPEDRIAKAMPMKPIAEVRAAEQYVNGVTAELNQKIANNEVDPAKLPCIMTLFAQLNSGAAPADDFQQSLVVNSTAQSVPEPAPAPAPAPTATQPADYGYGAPATTVAVDSAPTSTAAFEQAADAAAAPTVADAAAAPTVAVATPTGQYAYSSAKMRAAVASGATQQVSAASALGIVGAALLAVAAL